MVQIWTCLKFEHASTDVKNLEQRGGGAIGELYS